MGPGVIRVGDELWMYGCELDVPHDVSWHGRRVPGGVNRYVQRLDGFVSLDAGKAPGVVATKPFVLRGRILEVNADATFSPSDRSSSRGSFIQAEVLDAQEQVVAASELLHGDGIALKLVWKDRPDLREFVGQPIQLLFAMKMAKLYAFQVADAKGAPVRR